MNIIHVIDAQNIDLNRERHVLKTYTMMTHVVLTKCHLVYCYQSRFIIFVTILIEKPCSEESQSAIQQITKSESAVLGTEFIALAGGFIEWDTHFE